LIISISKLLKNKNLVNTGIYMAGNFLSRAIAFFVLPVFTRYLTPTDYGILSYTGSVTSFLLIISTLSLNSFVLRHYFEIKSEIKKRELFGTVFLFLIIVNIFLLLTEFTILPPLLKRFDIKVPFHPYFEIALAINFIDIIFVIPMAYLRVTKNAWGYFGLTSSKAVLSIILGLILVVGYKMGVMGRFYGSFYTNLVFFIICLVIMFKVSRFAFDLSTIKKGLRFSLPLVPSAIASIAIFSSDKIILERFVSLSKLGIYSVGLTIGTSMLIIVRSFYYAIEPEVYESFNKEGFEEKIVRLKRNFLYVLLIIGCIIIVFSKEIVTIMASERFYESYKIIPFFVTGSIFRGAEILVATTLFALNKTAYQPLITGAAVIFNISGNLILIPIMGIIGAALASVLSFLVLFMVSVYVTSRFSKIKWHCFKDIFLIGFFCGISVLIMNVKVGSLLMTGLMKLLIVLLLGVIAFYIFIKHRYVFLN